MQIWFRHSVKISGKISYKNNQKWLNQYNLTLQEYFSFVKEKIVNKDFKILTFNSLPKDEISVYLESINFLMYEWAEDNKDTRQYFDYIIKPNNTDWDFTSITFEEFIEFLGKNKSKEIVMVDISDIEIYNPDEDIDDFWLT